MAMKMHAADESEPRQVAIDHDKIQQALSGDRIFSVSCLLGVRYPVLKATLNRKDLHIRTSVSPCTSSRYNNYVYLSYTWLYACLHLSDAY
jgi:hypothetical protein